MELVLRIELDPKQSDGEPALDNPEEIINEVTALFASRSPSALTITNPNIETFEEALLECLAAIGVWATDWGGITVDVE